MEKIYEIQNLGNFPGVLSGIVKSDASPSFTGDGYIGMYQFKSSAELAPPISAFANFFGLSAGTAQIATLLQVEVGKDLAGKHIENAYLNFKVEHGDVGWASLTATSFDADGSLEFFRTHFAR